MHSFIQVRNWPCLPGWPFPVPFRVGRAGTFNHKSRSGCEGPGTRTCAAGNDIISPLEAIFPTKRLVVKSLFAAPDSRSHKPLTNSRPGVGAAWVLNKRLPVQKDFGRVAVPLLQRVEGWGNRGPPAR